MSAVIQASSENLDRQAALSIVVPFTTRELTAAALAAACRLGKGLAETVTLVAVQVIPRPNPLNQPVVDPKHTVRILRGVAQQSELPVKVLLVYARDEVAAYEKVLRRGTLVVVACRQRWWRSREERLAMKLARSGHHVSIIAA